MPMRKSEAVTRRRAGNIMVKINSANSDLQNYTQN